MSKKIVMYDQVPGFIEPVPITVDIGKLRIAMQEINQYVGYKPAEAVDSFNKLTGICLTYPLIIPDSVVDKWGDTRSKFVGPMSDGEPALRRNYNLSTSQFTEMHPVVQDSYIKEILDQLQSYTETRFDSGKICWIYSASMAPGGAFHLHKDIHCIGRYHIVETTTPYCYMMVEDKHEIKTVHLPADGQVWFLDTNVNHTAINITPSFAVEKLRTHLILSIYQQARKS